MKISIITVCRNSEKTIETTIKSVVNQTYSDIEYIIIDGDSQDRTKEIIQRYISHVSHFVSEPDSGIYNAMNKGIKLATGSYIQFLNSDDYLYDYQVIEDVVKFTQENPDCGIVYGDAEIRPDPKLSTHFYVAKSPIISNIPESLICGHSFLQGSMFCKSEIFSKLGLFNENYRIAGDYEFYTRFLGRKDLNIFYYSRVIFSYYSGGVSGNIPITLKEMFEIQNQVQFFQNEDWKNRRIVNLQNTIMELHEILRNQGLFIQKLKNPIFWLKIIYLKITKKTMNKM